MTLRVGLVGAGPWARGVHGPGVAGSDRTELVGVWARRPEAAGRLAETLGTRAYADVDELVADVDTVAFAVPPDVQVEVAVRAAEAGRHLVLEKPVAADLANAERLAAAVTAAGVRTGVFFTTRHTDPARTFLDEAAGGSWDGARVAWVGGGLLHGEFAASPWRHEQGALWDVGPHAVELVDAALGPVTAVRAAARGPRDLVHLVLEHDGGPVSQVVLSLRVPAGRPYDGVDLFGESGSLEFSAAGTHAGDAYLRLLTDLADQVEHDGAGPPCDVHRGLHVQRVLAEAERMIQAQS